MPFLAGTRDFFFCGTLGLALGPMQHPVQWILRGSFCDGGGS
jgi:hypothetical protein